MAKPTNEELLSQLADEFNITFETGKALVAEIKGRADRDLGLMEGVVGRMFDQFTYFAEQTGMQDAFYYWTVFSGDCSEHSGAVTRAQVFFEYDKMRSFYSGEKTRYWNTVRLEIEKKDTRYRLRIVEENRNRDTGWVCTQDQKIIAKADFDKIVKSLLEKAGEAALKADLKNRVKDLRGRLRKKQERLANRLSDKLSVS